MNKTAIKNFAIWARNKLIADVSYDARLIGITEDGIAKPLPQSFGGTQFFDIGTAEPYSISGEAVRQRDKLIEVIQQKEKDTDYKTAYQYVIEEVAYTWFNRLIAIRFMEVNDYLPSHIRVLSSESGKLEPDLVTTPFDAELPFTAEEEAQIFQLKQDNKLDEVFRILFLKQCNALNEILPALFEKTKNYTELLLSLSVIDQDGVVYHLIHDIPEDDFNIERGGLFRFRHPPSGARDPGRGLGKRGDHRLAVPVLQYRAEGRCLCKERQDHQRGNPCRDPVVYPRLDRSLHGGKQPWPSVGGRTPRLRPERKLEILSGRGTAGTGGAGKTGGNS